MRWLLAHAPCKATSLIALIILGFSASSCTHNVVAGIQPNAPAALMQTIRDYGTGHQRASAPAANSKPGLTEEDYQAQITQLMVQENFSQLEQIARANRQESDRLLGGEWKNYAYFEATGAGGDDLKASDYELAITRAKKWMAAYPDSAAAQISLSLIYVNYAAFARGTDFADAVSGGQWELFNKRLTLAKETLLGASRLKERDPRWYEAMQEVAFYQGWDRAQMTTLLDAAVSFEPEYFHFYREQSAYLMPQWYGQEGDIVAFAQDISKHFAEPTSSMLYFRIVSSLACYCSPAFQDLAGASWPKLKDGYDNIDRLYGISNLNANRFALMAYRFQDHAAAHDAFGLIVEEDSDVWSVDQVYESVRRWANLSPGLFSGSGLAGR